MTTTVHHLSIQLEHVEPKVQREFVVPSDLRLDRLHAVIQAVMGWTDTHLHEFIVGTLRDGIRYGRPDPEFAGFGPQTQKETTATLAQIAPAKGSVFRYGYDFGDDWMHHIKVKAIVPVDAIGSDIPFCSKGSGACPPEDCGGPWGYANLQAILADPAHEEHADMLEWIGGPFDPHFVDIDAINELLGEIASGWQRAPRRRSAAAKAAKPAKPVNSAAECGPAPEPASVPASDNVVAISTARSKRKG